MTGIEKAIKHFEGLQKRYTTTHDGKHCELVKTALAALRAEEEREKGCVWCKTPSHNHDIGGCTLVFYRSKAHPIGAYAISVSVFDEYGEEQEPVLVRIDNCIHCGKRLEVKHEDD